MKLADLGLKNKPATKYVEGGYVSFHTNQKTLYYEIYSVTKETQGLLARLKVETKEELAKLLSAKTINEVVQA